MEYPTDTKDPVSAGIEPEKGELEVLDAVAESRLVRKQDYYLIPMFTFIYLLGFLDKVNIGNAASNGLATSLNMSKYGFNIGTSLYYVAYILLDLPATLILKRFGTWTIPLAVFGLGCVTLGTAFIKTEGHFYAVRICLAVCEMPLLPGLSYMCTRYYRRSEITIRISTFYLVGAGLAQAFGSLLATLFFKIDSIGSVKGWRVLFLCEGIITIGLSPIIYFIFPADPAKTRYLNEEERELALARLQADMPGSKTHKEATSMKLIIRSIFNVPAMAYVWIFICSNVTVQGLAIFQTSILKANYPTASVIRIQVLSIAPPIVSIVYAFGVAYVCMKKEMHAIGIAFSALLSVVGYAIWLATDSTQASARYAAIFLNSMSGFAYGSILVGWALSNTAPDTARAVVSAALPALGDLGGFCGVWAYISTDAVNLYRIGNSINVSFGSTVIIVAAFLFIHLKRENKARAEGKRDHLLESPEAAELGDRHPNFRYVY